MFGTAIFMLGCRDANDFVCWIRTAPAVVKTLRDGNICEGTKGELEKLNEGHAGTGKLQLGVKWYLLLLSKHSSHDDEGNLWSCSLLLRLLRCLFKDWEKVQLIFAGVRQAEVTASWNPSCRLPK